jgi:hypothetical protein
VLIGGQYVKLPSLSQANSLNHCGGCDFGREHLGNRHLSLSGLFIWSAARRMIWKEETLLISGSVSKGHRPDVSRGARVSGPNWLPCGWPEPTSELERGRLGPGRDSGRAGAHNREVDDAHVTDCGEKEGVLDTDAIGENALDFGDDRAATIAAISKPEALPVKGPSPSMACAKILGT